jgi:hypothetical protein
MTCWISRLTIPTNSRKPITSWKGQSVPLLDHIMSSTSMICSQDIFTIVIPAPDTKDFKTFNLFTKNETRLQSTMHVSRSHKMMCTADQNNKWFWQNLNLRFAQPHVHRYVYVLSLCHLYPLLFT